jgi:NadR type nicotinamide-nucleotide adenylyltransferase
MANRDEPIPLGRRVDWLRDEHRTQPNVDVLGVVDDVPVDYDDADIWAQHVSIIRSVVPSATAVFTSEEYGAELARRFGATDVRIDQPRELVPVSATRIRADLVGNWEHLSPAVRGGLALRVVVIGSESTGKTTLSRALVDALRARGGAHGLTRWVPEHGRPYTIDKLAIACAAAGVEGRPRPTMDDLVWTSDEFEAIAQVQNTLEDQAARIGGPVLVCDTDAFATSIWHERYLDAPSKAVAALTRRHPLYLLTHHDDVPFEPDGIRDGAAIRGWMTDRFTAALGSTGRHTVVLRGTHDEQMATALSAIDAELARPFEDREWAR